MAFLLNSDNILAYLLNCNLLEASPLVESNQSGSGLSEVAPSSRLPSDSLLSGCLKLEPKPGKNFNLRVRYGQHDWLVKQESHGVTGEAAGELRREQQFFQWLAGCLGLEDVRSHLIQPVHFDPQNSIIVFPYLKGTKDLSDVFHEAEGLLPTAIATQIGDFFGALHSSTFHHKGCKAFAAKAAANAPSHQETPPDFLRGLRQLTPETFCVIPTEALKFFRFYQRYPAISTAIEHLSQTFDPCCMVHNDPRFANFLLREPNSQTNEIGKLYPIDWEKWAWGDPLYDVARLIANYLKLWLKSLPISSDVDLKAALSRASVPLSAVQPSTTALVKAYLARFPNILLHRTDFTPQLVQFVGLALLRQVQLYIAQKHPIGNIEMAMAQVAKTLLCQPEMAVETIFGCTQETLEEANSHAESSQYATESSQRGESNPHSEFNPHAEFNHRDSAVRSNLVGHGSGTNPAHRRGADAHRTHNNAIQRSSTSARHVGTQ
ncbi:MAG: phosphotransferase family protein [Phormidesmis sp.]